MQFQGKLMIQTQQNGKKSHFGPDLGPLDPKSGSHFFFKNVASLVTRYHFNYHHVQYQKKLMIQS